MGFLLRTIAVAVATGVASSLLPGIALTGDSAGAKVATLLAVAVIIGLVNAVVKPVVTALSGCLVWLTLGLFLLVINAAMLLLSSWIAGRMGLGFHVDGFVPAVLGSIVISVVAAVVGGLLSPLQARD